MGWVVVGRGVGCDEVVTGAGVVTGAAAVVCMVLDVGGGGVLVVVTGTGG